MPMPGNVSQGPTLRRISRQSTDQTKVEYALSELKTGKKPLIEIAKLFDVVTTDGERDHLLDHWFGRKPWWPHLKKIEAVLRQAFIEALTLAQESKIPIEVYWICAGPGAHFEVSCACSPRQVTMMILTPSVPKAAHDLWRGMALDADDPIVFIRQGPLGDDAYGQEVLRDEDGVLTLKMKTRVAND